MMSQSIPQHGKRGVGSLKVISSSISLDVDVAYGDVHEWSC